MRVLLHQGPRGCVPVQLDMMTPGARIACEVCINTGTLAMLPDGSIAEPVEVFDTDVEAREHRTQMLAKWPELDLRIILNADVAV